MTNPFHYFSRTARAQKWYRKCIDLDVEPRIVAKIIREAMEGKVNLTQIALAETRAKFNLPNWEPQSITTFLADGGIIYDGPIRGNLNPNGHILFEDPTTGVNFVWDDFYSSVDGVLSIGDHIEFSGRELSDNLRNGTYEKIAPKRFQKLNSHA